MVLNQTKETIYEYLNDKTPIVSGLSIMRRSTVPVMPSRHVLHLECCLVSGYPL